jgi:hypothetical protein
VTGPAGDPDKIINLEPDRLAVCPIGCNCWGQPGKAKCQSPCINTINPGLVRAAVLELLNKDSLIVLGKKGIDAAKVGRDMRQIITAMSNHQDEIEKLNKNKLFPVITECEYAYLVFDRDGGLGLPEIGCYNKSNIPEGVAWGKCNKKDCPIIKDFDDNGILRREA